MRQIFCSPATKDVHEIHLLRDFARILALKLSIDIHNTLTNTEFTATVRGASEGGVGRELITVDFQITFDILLTRQSCPYNHSEKPHFHMHSCMSSQSFQLQSKLGHTDLDQSNHMLKGYKQKS
jgi:hypothetical protein